MRWIHLLPLRLRSLFTARKLDRDLDEEIQFHLDRQIEANVAGGMSPQEARFAALKKIDGLALRKEDCRDARGTRWLDDFWRDATYSLRTIRQNPGFAAIALCTLGLGIGATTLMFTLINGVLLKPFPFPDPERLLALQERTEEATQFGNLWAFSYPNFLDVQREIRTLTISASRYRGGTVSSPGVAEYVNAREVSSEFFSVLGIRLAEGRSFLAEEDQAGAPPIAVLSEELRQRQFGSSPAIGRTVIFDGSPYTVVGIVPAGFRSLGAPDLFVPLGQNTAPYMKNREAHPVPNVIARLKAGVTLDEARVELDRIGRQVAAHYPASNKGRTFIADPFRPNVGDTRTTLWLLLGAVSLVLLIGCVNVASLNMARAIARRGEFVMRAALGASRSRLIRQCLTENAVLGVSGGALGVALAIFGLKPFIKFWPGTLPRAEEAQIDWRVLAFALGVSIVSSLLFGLAPALRLRTRGIERIPRGAKASTDPGSRRLYACFVVSEIALALVLLVSAGVFGRTMLRLSRLDPGLNAENVLVTRMALSPETLRDPVRIRTAWQNALDRARAVPGVESAAAVDTVPMRRGDNQLAFSPTPTFPDRRQLPLTLATSVTEDYFKVMDIPLLQGRFFTGQDRIDSEVVVVVDEVLAKQAFPGDSAVGKPLWLPDFGPKPVHVVGVVRHVRHWGLAGDDQAKVRAQLYYPFSQVEDRLLRRWSELMSIAVRTSVPPLDTVAALRQELRGANSDQVLYEVRTMDQLASETIGQQRFLLLLFGIFAGLGLLLACLGVYGVLSYSVSQRVPEIGVRIALGASRRGVIGMILRQCITFVVIGVGLGLGAAAVVGRLLEGAVAGVERTSPWMLAATAAAFAGVALFAGFLPARRASGIDPTVALRRE